MSGWKSTSRRRGQRVCLHTGLVPRRNFLLARVKSKGFFPLILEENPCFPGNQSHLEKTSAALSREKSPHSLIFFPIYTNLFCFLPLRLQSCLHHTLPPLRRLLCGEEKSRVPSHKSSPLPRKHCPFVPLAQPGKPCAAERGRTSDYSH